MQVFDRLNQDVLDDFEAFRRRNFNYLYFCAACNRSFDSKIALDNCKFCSGALKELWSSQRAKKTERNFRYFCTICDKNFVAPEKPEVCEICGSRFIHAYEWERLGRDVLRTRFRRTLQRLKNVEKLRLPKLQQRAEAKKFSFNLQNIRIRIPKIQLSKSEEELPTR